MWRGLVLIAALLPLLNGIAALDAAGWKRQSIYQILTDRFNREDGDMTPCDLAAKDYCGGTWRGIIEKLDYIQDMGFTAIWISPVIENLPRGYHGYFGLSPYKLNSHFGTAQDLKDLSTALHDRSMYLMIDVVPNHLAATSVFSPFSPAEAYYPFNKPEHFHPACYIQDWDNQTQVEDCWLGPFEDVSLVDLDTRHPEVVEELKKWVRWLVTEFGVDGLRLDTVKHVNKDFWPDFIEAAGVFCIGEVYHGNPDYVVGYQWDAMESLFNFPIYYPLTRAFSSITGDIFELTNMILTMQAKAKDITLLAAFTDNHDVKRFNHYTPDPSLRQNAVCFNMRYAPSFRLLVFILPILLACVAQYAFSFVADGFPVTYSGSEHALEGHNDPFNREPTWLYGFDQKLPHYELFKRINRARQLALEIDPSYIDKTATPLVTSEHELVLRRGPLISVFSNRGAQSGMSLIYAQIDGLKTGSYLVDLLASEGSPAVMVGHGGNVRFEVYDGRPRVFMEQAMLTKHRDTIHAESFALRPGEGSATATSDGVLRTSSSAYQTESVTQTVSSVAVNQLLKRYQVSQWQHNHTGLDRLLPLAAGMSQWGKALRKAQ